MEQGPDGVFPEKEQAPPLHNSMPCHPTIRTNPLFDAQRTSPDGCCARMGPTLKFGTLVSSQTGVDRALGGGEHHCCSHRGICICFSRTFLHTYSFVNVYSPVLTTAGHACTTMVLCSIDERNTRGKWREYKIRNCEDYFKTKGGRSTGNVLLFPYFALLASNGRRQGRRPSHKISQSGRWG
jgi:hypothetical protein